jgi:hypothetical protein
MGWEPFEYGEPLNPEKLNSKFNQVYTLLSKAYSYNNLLKRKLDTVNAALTISSQIFDIAGDGTLIGDASKNRRLYDLPVNGNTSYELFIGGEYFESASSSNDVTIVSSDLESDGLYTILPTSGDIIGRVPLTTNEYGEQKPSLGTEITSSVFDNTKLYNILSPSAVWAEVVNPSSLETLELADSSGTTQTYNIGRIDLTLPDGLSPYMNKISITPLIGTSYRLFYHAGEARKVVDSSMATAFITGTSNFYIERDIFDGRLSLELIGTSVPSGTGFGLMKLGANYYPFTDTGSSTIRYSLNNAIASINITTIQNNLTLTEGSTLSIYSDSSLSTQIYNSSQDGFPFTGVKTVTKEAGETSINLYIKILMKKYQGTSPTLPYLKIKYEDTTYA